MDRKEIVERVLHSRLSVAAQQAFLSRIQLDGGKSDTAEHLSKTYKELQLLEEDLALLED